MSSDKIFVTKTPAMPSHCAVCYTQAKGNQDFIDFGASLDFYGAILICDLCIVNAALLVGYIPVAKFELAENQANAAITAHLEASKKVRILESFIAAYTSDPEFSIDSLLNSNPELSLFGDVAGESNDSSAGSTEDESGLVEPVTV